MPDLLLELLSEEIPARMQAQAANDLRTLVTDALVGRGLVYEGAQSFVTPRRLTLHVAGLPALQPSTREERKGPRVGAPEAAILGFLKSAGLANIGQATVVSDPKKGDFYMAVTERAGRSTIEVLAEILPDIVRGFPWPKSMRWGAGSATPDALRWVRPLQSIVCTFGADTEEPEVVPFTVGGVVAGSATSGHRFLAPNPFAVKRFDDYAAALEKRFVVLDAGRRVEMIRHDARDLAFAQGFELVEDEALLAEVAGLVEWPVVLMGSFDESFLAIPPEVIRATIRANQKCFVLRRPGSATLANRFILTANIAAPDDGAAIVAGNERVVRARLSDAKFFYDADRKVPLEHQVTKLDSIVFHEKLGTQGERVGRIAALVRELAPVIGAEVGLAERAARLAKADLVTGMVGEFPELQGLMGRYYAAAQGEDSAVAAALEEHYRPQGPADIVPRDPVSVVVALADKLDMLAGFWAIGEKPTGSKDPFALRRAALGVIRILLETNLRLPLLPLLKRHASLFRRVPAVDAPSTVQSSVATDDWTVGDGEAAQATAAELLVFFADRLKVYLRDLGARHDLIDAVFALAGQDDLLMVVRRVDALGRLLATDDGRSLLAGYRRAANILRAEEKKDGAGAFDGPWDTALFRAGEEQALAEALAIVAGEAASAIAREDFESAMRAMARLRTPVDAFFERVTVNADEPALRTNRLRLLAALRRTTRPIADLSRVVG